MPTIVVLLLTSWIAAAGYLLACRIWPFGACSRCHGDGKRRSPSGQAWRRCARCSGSGARLRTGRKAINRFSQAARRGTR